jgi:hypothetical protein
VNSSCTTRCDSSGSARKHGDGQRGPQVAETAQVGGRRAREQFLQQCDGSAELRLVRAMSFGITRWTRSHVAQRVRRRRCDAQDPAPFEQMYRQPGACEIGRAGQAVVAGR